MLYQIADSESTFIAAIAVIAGIVMVFIAIATFVLLRSENKEDKAAPSVDAPQPILPGAITVPSQPGEREKDALPSALPAEIDTVYIQNERPEDARSLTPNIEAVAAAHQAESKKHELPPIAPLETTAASATEERPTPRFALGRITKEMLAGIPLTALLMCFLIFGLGYMYEKALVLWEFRGAYSLGLWNLLWAGIALGGSIGLRIFRLDWRHVVAASLLAGAVLLLLGRLRPTFFTPGDPFDMFLISGGVFLLPLLDPRVRRNGPAPSPWKLALVASVLSFLIFFLSTFPLAVFIGDIFLDWLLSLGMLLGLLLSLSKIEKNVADGARVGGLIILTHLLTMIIFSLLR